MRLTGVSKRFPEVLAVDHLDLEIASGEFFSLLGPSGCGKTTTLRIIGGFEDPTTGVVYLGGKDVTAQPAYKRDVNTVFQSYALFPHLDVFENVAFGLRRAHVDKREIGRRVGEALELVDLPGYEKRKPVQLSGGQQQRVALARALVNHPKLLLLDEPLGALDLKLRKQMQLELKRIQREVGITFLYVTHDQEEAMTMSNRLAVMRAGRIEQIGIPEAVYEHPETEFVAGFLGASNFLTGAAEASDGRWTKVELKDGSVVRVRADALRAAGSRFKLGVRPEKIRLAPAGASISQDLNAIAGRVTDQTFVGVGHQYGVEVSAGASMTVYAQNLGGDEQPREGDDVIVTWMPQHTFAVKAER